MQFPLASLPLQQFLNAMALALVLPLSSCGGGGGGGGGGGADAGAAQVVALTGVLPKSCPLQGGMLVALSGTGFLAGGSMQVYFGGKLATNVTVVSDTSVTCRTPASAAAGVVTVRAQNSAGSASLEQAFSYSGWSIIDFNGDGLPDTAVGAKDHGSNEQGAVYVFFGRPIGAHDIQAGNADLKINGIGSSSDFGHRIGAGDVNGDGRTDLVVSAPRTGTAGSVRVFFGPLSGPGPISAGSSNVLFTGAGVAPGDLFGESLAVGDLDGDGIDDILVGAVHHDSPIADGGAVYLFRGGPGLASRSAGFADSKWTGASVGSQFGKDLALGDVNGDTQLDLLVGSPQSGAGHGDVSIYFGGSGFTGGPSNHADWRIRGEVQSDLFGAAVSTGDVNGDGISDVLVGAPGNDAGGSSTGAAYAFFGGGARVTGAAQADAILLGARPGDEFGRGLACGDVDGDGFADLAVGARGVDAGATNNGRVYTFMGRASFGDGVAGNAEMMFTGLAITNESFGQTVEIFDMDADGFLDICVGSFQVGSGDVHVFLGGHGSFDLPASQDSATWIGEVGGDYFGCSIAVMR